MTEKINVKQGNFFLNSGSTITFKLIAIGILFIFLMIPLSVTESTISGRSILNLKAQNDIAQSWSLPQTITGPFIVVPYMSKNDNKTQKYHMFMPQTLNIEAVINPEVRYRGLFQAIVYQSNFKINGNFANPNLFKQDSEKIFAWKDAMFIISLTDLRGITQAKILLNGKEHTAKSGSGIVNEKLPGFHTDIDFDRELEFSMLLELKGTTSLDFIPLGVETNIDVKSSWTDPSFTGNFLPIKRIINSDGFSASWKIPYLARPIPESFDAIYDNIIINSKQASESNKNTSFGVKLISPKDHYHQAERATKYWYLFVIYTYLAFFLFEVVRKIRIHIFQYALTGVSLISFFLMLAAFSEHLNFNASYLIASLAIITQISLYACKVITGKFEKLFFISIFSVLYLYLFVLLRMESYTLLVGSISLFITLSFTMYYTRNLSWFEEK